MFIRYLDQLEFPVGVTFGVSHRPSVFVKTCVTEWEEVRRDWRKLHVEKLVVCSPREIILG
jgi:hypothetical protein